MTKTTSYYTRGSERELRVLREMYPDWEVIDRRPKSGAWWLDVLLLWFAAFGVWPLFNPGHDWDTVASVVDVGIHWAALVALGTRWKVSRR